MKITTSKNKKFKIIDMEKNYSSGDAMYEIIKHGRAVTIEELEALVKENPDDFIKSRWYLAFGSSSVNANGNRRVPDLYLYSDGSVRRDWHYWDVDWNADDCLVLLCDSTVNTRTSENTDTLTPDLQTALDVVKSAGYLVYKQL